jgi:hypothetical protein
MARHPPANYRPEMSAAAPSPFVDADAIAKRYGFAEGFDLRGRLDEAAGMYGAFRSTRQPTPKQRRKRLALIEKETHAILGGQVSRREALAKLLVAGGSAGIPLADDAVERGLGVGDLSDVFTQEYLNTLLETAAAASAALQRRRPPVSGDPARRILVQDLASIWQDGTGKPAPATWDEYGEKHSDAILFMRDVFRRLGERVSEEAVRHLLRRGRAGARRGSQK